MAQYATTVDMSFPTIAACVFAVSQTAWFQQLVEGPLKDYIWSYSLFYALLMKLSTQIKPISYLKANAAEVIRDLTEQRRPLVITQNGEAKVVMQDVASYEQTQETLALLKILALGNRQIEQGRVVAAADAISRLREKSRGRKPLG